MKEGLTESEGKKQLSAVQANSINSMALFIFSETLFLRLGTVAGPA